MRLFILLILLLFSSFPTLGQSNPLVAADSLEQQAWVDTRYNEMSLDQRIGQLFMVMVTSARDQARVNQTLDMIKEHHIGGLIFSTGGPSRQAQLTNQYQAASRVPLLIGMDAEWGLSMRLDSTYAFPWNMTLGAISDSSIVEEVGHRIGVHAKRLGVHINFAPDIDINTNPRNPIIGNRSFGEDPENVANKGVALMQGMHKAGILSSGKHFPGHGDTEVDSHKGLPLIDASRERLDSVELLPFRKLIENGVSSIMVAHLNVPALEDDGMPSSLSKKIITGLLREELGYKGLIFTDALNMSGVTSFAAAGETEVQAFLAGNDMLLMPKDLALAHANLKRAYEEGRITEQRLESSVKKILMAKYKAGLHRYRPIDLKGLYADLNSLDDDLVYEKAIENALTVVKNQVGIMGIKKLENKKIAYVKFGDDESDPFLNALNRYAEVTQINARDIAGLKENLAAYNLVIIGYHKTNDSPWGAFKFSEKEKYWLHEIARDRGANVILSVFAKPYALMDMPSYDEVDGILVAYQNSRMAQEKAAEVIFGAIPAKGILPVTAHSEFPVNTAIVTDSLQRLGYSNFPERVGMSSSGLAEIDRLVGNGLDSLMFPGAQVLVARKGKVIYQKAFGKPTYESENPLTLDHIYDLASLTKILATLPVVMKMEEEGSLPLNATFQELLPEFTDTELKDVTVLKALSHYGRLPAWIAFYLDTLNEERRPSNDFYRNHMAEGFSIKVTDRMYLADEYTDSIYNRIGRQHLKSNRYRYSDVAYYIMKKYIEESQKRRLDDIVNDLLYSKIGANNTSYNPLEKYPLNRIVPSEVDDYYRYQIIQGYVHDMGAAMQGGVGGHAGLFSNANDVAKIMQMYLQGGYYGGQRFLEERTVEKFNKCYFCDKSVRRGIGFDKPEPNDKGPTCGCVSRKSFGHSGFTGTYTWADPEEEIVYVFLSNRTYPSAANTLLVQSALRTRIQQAIYDSIIN